MCDLGAWSVRKPRQKDFLHYIWLCESISPRQYFLTFWVLKISEIGDVITNFKNTSSGNLLDTKLLSGPATCCDWCVLFEDQINLRRAHWHDLRRNLYDVIKGGLDEYPYKYYTFVKYSYSWHFNCIDTLSSIQHYPDNSCNGINAENTNISYFTSHANGMQNMSFLSMMFFPIIWHDSRSIHTF